MMERYKAYKESGLPWLGTMPEHWEVTNGKRLYYNCDGGVWGDDPIGNDSDTIVLRSTEQNIDGQLIIQDPARRLLTQVEKENCLLYAGDLIITKSSGSAAHIGKTSIIDDYTASLNCCYSNFLQRIRIKGSAKYYWYVFNSSIVRLQFQIMSTSTTGLGNLSATIIKEILLPVPPLEEQRAIAEYLDRETVRIDRIVELLTKQRERYAQLKRSLISEVVTHGLPHHNPANYRTLRLKDIVSSFETGKRETTSIEEVLSIGGEHIQNGKFFLENPRYVSKEFYNSNNGKIKIGDTLVVKDGATIGKSMFVDSLPSEQMLLNEHVYRLEPNRLFCLPIYLYYIINSTATQEYFRAMNMSTAQESITRITMNSLPISLPPLEEQQEIVAYLDERCKRLDRLVEAIDRKIDLLGSLKKSLIEEVVTGQRRITN